MLLLRAALLELLVCYHVIGGAVLFRRLFPRESAWLAFLLPTLFVMCTLNFLEHFIPLPELGWLLPVGVIGLGWVMVKPGNVWRELWLPGGLFVGIFTWVFFIRCLNPSITCNTEGVADMARVLDFCLGSRLPAVDSWCPPYDHGGYYSFQHYGASLLTRFLQLDIGTGYNVGYSLLNAFVFFAGAGAAYHISGGRVWVCLATLLVLMANFNGASVVLFVWARIHPLVGVYDIFDSRLAVDIGDGWNNPARHNPFGGIFNPAYPPPVLRLFTPAFNTYFPEFHANLGGHFMTIATMLAANEIFRPARANWPWVCLLIFPILTIITSTWFIVIVGVLCAGALVTALLCGRRPESWQLVAAGFGIALMLIWPSVNSLISGNYPVNIHLTPWAEMTNPWEFLIQWWVVIIPWLALLFLWPWLNGLARWILLAVPLLLVFIELVTFSDRGLTVEKMWGAVYSTSLVTFIPLVFAQRALFFRILCGCYIAIAVLFFAVWAEISYDGAWAPDVCQLRGDIIFQIDPQKKRLEQVLSRFHGIIVLNGKSAEAYNESPSLVGFTENMCYIAWFFQEFQCGHGGEAEFRDQQSNAFFAGTMPDPLGFLRSNHISAVMIYPDDNIPNDVLAKLTDALAPDFYYIDCKGNDPGLPNNAGVFVKK
jgi:hypothetical protein